MLTLDVSGSMCYTDVCYREPADRRPQNARRSSSRIRSTGLQRIRNHPRFSQLVQVDGAATNDKGFVLTLLIDVFYERSPSGPVIRAARCRPSTHRGDRPERSSPSTPRVTRCEATQGGVRPCVTRRPTRAAGYRVCGGGYVLSIVAYAPIWRHTTWQSRRFECCQKQAAARRVPRDTRSVSA